MTDTLVELTRENQVAWLTLQRPDKLNALSPELQTQAVEILRELAVDDEVRCVVISGAGRAFSAGADLAAMRDLDPLSTFRQFSALTIWRAVEALPQPTIAAVHGVCLGGGCELALACDLRLAADDARFGQPEINVGIIPGAGGTQRLSRLIGMARAKEMVLFGELVNAEEAYRIGLVNRVVPRDQLLAEARTWATKLAQKPFAALRLAKRVMDRGEELDLPSALDLERLAFSLLFQSEDQKEGMSAFVEKRPPSFKGR